MKHQTVTIIGAGIAGLTTAIALQKIGIEPVIFEASSENKPLGAGLGLGLNAMKALRSIELDEEISKHGFPLKTFEIFDSNGKQISKSALKWSSGLGNMAIHRAALQQILLSKLDPNMVLLDKKTIGVEESSFGLWIQFADGSRHFTNYLVVADGIHSVIRQKLLPTSKPVYAGYTCWRSVVDSPEVFTPDSYETWGKSGRFGVVPIASNKSYWFACINAKERDDRYRKFTLADLQHQFKNYPATIPSILGLSTDEKLIHNDIYDVRPLNQFAFGRMVLIGDAAHATTPNMGQGACQAIESAVELAACMNKETDFEMAFQHFEKRRLARTRWVIKTSRKIGRIAQLENPLLIELRNAAFRIIPDGLADANLTRLGSVHFEELKPNISI